MLVHIRDHRELVGAVRVFVDGEDVTNRCRGWDAKRGKVLIMPPNGATRVREGALIEETRSGTVQVVLTQAGRARGEEFGYTPEYWRHLGIDPEADVSTIREPEDASGPARRCPAAPSRA